MGNLQMKHTAKFMGNNIKMHNVETKKVYLTQRMGDI